jgi:hypothetical protein
VESSAYGLIIMRGGFKESAKKRPESICKKKGKKQVSDYFGLPSVKCLYFKTNNMLYKMNGSQPIFENPISLEDVDDLWINKLSKEDKKLIEKDLKKFKKI